MTMIVRHTDKSLYGDIDQQLRYVLMPDGLFFFFFFSGERDRDKEINIIDGLGKRAAPLQHVQTINESDIVQVKSKSGVTDYRTRMRTQLSQYPMRLTIVVAVGDPGG